MISLKKDFRESDYFSNFVKLTLHVVAKRSGVARGWWRISTLFAVI